jgi:hypothetical protein
MNYYLRLKTNMAAFIRVLQVIEKSGMIIG